MQFFDWFECENFCEIYSLKMLNLNVKTHLKESFFRLKPLCDSVMVKPSAEHIAEFMAMMPTVKQENLQELQHYVLFPFITHIKSAENKKNYGVLIHVIDAMTTVLEHIKLTTFDVTMKTEISLLSLVFDRAKPGLLAEVPEELKLSVMKCLTALMLGVTTEVKVQMLRTQMAVLAQAVFVSVHIAKLDRMRALRLASIDCLKAHTMSHQVYMNESLELKDKDLEDPAGDFLSSILPGVLAALQDVAMCPDNPGHAVIVSALDATHRILCIAMHNKRLKKKKEVDLFDFSVMMAQTNGTEKPPNKVPETSCKSVRTCTQEWYKVAGEKLLVVTKSLAPLVAHEHYLVRRELAMMCARIVHECCDTLPSSLPLALDVLISLSKDDYTEVSGFCKKTLNVFFTKSTPHRRMLAMDGLCDNFFITLTNLPRILNNIDSGRKLASLKLVRGYLETLSTAARPQRLTLAVSAARRCDALADALLAAAALHRDQAPLTRRAAPEITTDPVSHCPWLQLRHLDSIECQKALQGIIQQLAAAECAELLLDRLLELFHQRRDCELVYIMNWMGSAPDASTSLAKRIINTYIQDDIWNLPLDIENPEKPLTKEETLDPEVYNPRTWVKDSVPGLYEGTTEVRYTDISYKCPRLRPRSADACRTAAQSQRNLAMCCLLTEGVGVLARRLGQEYQPFLLRTLCLILERVGSKYEMLHRSGGKALADVAAACELPGPAALIALNADYFTSQITTRLKKSWDVQSALQILTVVMTYSDTSILEYLYAVVEDVLLQSCDKYHQKNLFAYLQVFECFMHCIHKWFPIEKKPVNLNSNATQDYFGDFSEYVKNTMSVDRLLTDEEYEKDIGKSAEEMYKEDLEKKQEEDLHDSEEVTKDPAPLPKHISITVEIIKRSIHFITAKERDEGILAMHIILIGLPLLREYEDELLPLVHQCWAPLVGRFVPTEPLVMRKAFELLVVIATVAKDFICGRVLKDVFPQIVEFLSRSAADSVVKSASAAPAHRHAAAFALQTAALGQVPALLRHVSAPDAAVRRALTAAKPYLSRRQPKQLQALAVKFHKSMLAYDYCATWQHLRELCGNGDVVRAPPACLPLCDLVGTPYAPADRDYDANVRAVFDIPYE